MKWESYKKYTLCNSILMKTKENFFLNTRNMYLKLLFGMRTRNGNQLKKKFHLRKNRFPIFIMFAY